MKYNYILLFLIAALSASGQSTTLTRFQQNPANGLQLGGYAQIDFNQSIYKDQKSNGKLDIHRFITTLGYRFNKKVSFFSEIEIEHVKEITVEQAFLNYKINKSFQIRSGLLLIPMGIVNEYHEPPTFNGVERPNVDKNVVPSTWREIGIGVTGRFDEIALRYQAYLVNGFASFNGSGLLKGSNGLRKGRQKAAESFITTPNLSTKIDYYGISGLKLGLAGYFGKTQSSLFNHASDNEVAQMQADSSQVGVNMIGFDARYTLKGLQLRGQYIIANLSNTKAYNSFTSSDLGSQLLGYYVEAGYNVLQKSETTDQLTPFVRFEQYNTHSKTEEIVANDAYNLTEVTFGIGWRPTSQVVYKADYQVIKSKADTESHGQLNLGVGLQF